MTKMAYNSKKLIALNTLIAWWFICFTVPAFAEDSQLLGNVPTRNYDETGRKLPPGVPREVDTNGAVVYVNHHFTTPAYQNEALRLAIQEANEVAKALKLPEQLPITRSNLLEYHISPFGFAYAFKMIGGITTKNYVYYISCGNKFSDLDIANYDQTCLKLKDRGSWPISKMDTNTVFSMATNWLSKISMDVAGLNRECIAHVAVSPFWNNLAHLGEVPQKRFVPIYYVWWTYPGHNLEGEGGPATVELYTPDKTILQLSVSDQKYILRKPLEFTNMAALFPGDAPIHTNYYVKPIVIDASLWSTN